MIRVLGVDYGDRRIGIAISDPTGTIARPLQLIEGKKDEQAPDFDGNRAGDKDFTGFFSELGHYISFL